MIACTSKNGQSVRLSAEYWVDVGHVYYNVHCNGAMFEFKDFAPAASVYRTLSRKIEDGMDISTLLKNLVKGARILGLTVKESSR